MRYRTKVVKHTDAFIRVEGGTLPYPVLYIPAKDSGNARTGHTVDIERSILGPTMFHGFEVVRIVPMVRRQSRR